MCLGIPGRVVRMAEGYHDQVALVDVSGETRKVNIGMLDDGPVRPGEWVIIHMGFAVERTDEAGAAEALAGLRLLGSGEEP
ncbi:HypC/HybG/HupF family hydrogenase formation chaperone [Nocardia amikacinitolerans]|uniref:HypC/HybG/HupF family hydrogenase formation chaperone n=1 Tax=Nocardia amikacinitolerans TaxID=756689 RepID=UPI0020A33198|nr:HypC/HybG/HupF family hydrogenase formation chaperone [Nocardia amikacinitolerans]MCP2289720.1 hydrogenase expression/formation protein HypC [Nocardia amikacinitolerans]